MAGWTGTPFQIRGNGSATKPGAVGVRYSITGVWATMQRSYVRADGDTILQAVNGG